jgi:hypothetical protein
MILFQPMGKQDVVRKFRNRQRNNITANTSTKKVKAQATVQAVSRRLLILTVRIQS